MRLATISSTALSTNAVEMALMQNYRLGLGQRDGGAYRAILLALRMTDALQG